jgi:hypothetical protein
VLRLISWWMTHDKCDVYAFHVRDWRGWHVVRSHVRLMFV